MRVTEINLIITVVLLLFTTVLVFSEKSDPVDMLTERNAYATVSQISLSNDDDN